MASYSDNKGAVARARMPIDAHQYVLLAYAVAFIVSAAMLAMFGRVAP